jgi:hypothetical protein
LQRGRRLTHGLLVTGASGQLARHTETLVGAFLRFDARGSFERLATRQQKAV